MTLNHILLRTQSSECKEVSSIGTEGTLGGNLPRLTFVVTTLCPLAGGWWEALKEGVGGTNRHYYKI